ncbi:MAG TPA: universal stress protein [Candidatus Angelobacter sp.]|nr:universal stress protein [Candidatus Angelobacter sp.]
MAAIVPVLPGIGLKRILFATDFSPASRAALPLVAAIARHYGSHVLLAHIASPAPYPLVPPEVIAVLDRRKELEARKELEVLLHSDLLHGIKSELLVRSGSTIDELERIVRQDNVDLAVASTHGRTGLQHRVLGSVTEDMVRRLSCPVLSVGPSALHDYSASKSISSILFPTDFSQDSLAVFPYLASLANEYRSRLTVLHVMSLQAARTPGAAKQADSLRRRMQQALGNEISPRCKAEFVIESGDAVECILACARQTQADLIGLGVRCATDIATHFHATAAYRILCDAQCPVLTHHATGGH